MKSYRPLRDYTVHEWSLIVYTGGALILFGYNTWVIV